MTRSENPSVSGARPEQANSSRANDSVAPPLRPGKQESFDIRRQCNAAALQMPFLLLALAACGGGEGVGGEGARRATHTISLELVGNHDRPVIVSETAASGASGGFLPDTHARLWAWWQDKFIIQRTSKDRAEQKSVLLEPGLDTSVWRFLAQAGLLVAVLRFYPF